MAGLPPLQPPLPVAPAVGMPAPTAVVVGMPVAAPGPAGPVVVRADLAKSRFAGIMRWAPDMLNPRNVGPEHVVAYFLMLQDVYSGVTGSVLLPEGLQALWAAAFYLKRFGKITYKPDLVSYTANGICSAVHPDGPSASPAMFVKAQLRAISDDIRMDCMSSVVMSDILTHEALAAGKHPLYMHSAVMRFTDAFLAVLETTGAGAGVGAAPAGAPHTFRYDLAEQIVEGRLLPVNGFFPSDVPRELQAAVQAAEERAAALGAPPGSDRLSTGADLTFAKGYPMPYLSLLRTENPNALLAPAAAFDAIDGVSLRTLIYKLSPTSDFSAVAERLSFLAGVMQVLGKYGWVHNDLHLDNVLYDRVHDRLVLIDYGRTFLDPRTLPAEIRESADREMLKLDMLLSAKHLKEVADEAGGFGIRAEQADCYTRFMDAAFTKVRIPIIAPQLLTVFGRVPTHFGKYLFMYDLATMVLGIMKRTTVPNAPALKVAEDFTRAFSDTGIAEMNGTNLMILDLDSFVAVLAEPQVAAGIPEHMQLFLAGLLWTSMVLTAIRDDGLRRGVQRPPVYTATVNDDFSRYTMITDFTELSALGLVFIGGFQFQTPCVDESVFKMFPRVEGYIRSFFDTGFLVAPPVPGGAASAAMRSRFAPSVALRSRFASAQRSAARAAPSARGAKIRPIAWSDPKSAGDALDPSVIVDKRRATPTSWARKALSEYVSPLRGLPPVFRLDAAGGVAPAKLAGGAAKRSAAKRAAGGAAPSAPGELMRRVRAMLQALPDPNAAKTARLVAELENTRPFAL